MNISEGRNQPLLEKFSKGIKESSPEIHLFSCSSDKDHNRSVFTFAGSPQGVLEASWQACKATVSALDIRLHQGVHPRIGVVDVIPFVPLRNTSMEECSDIARQLGNRVGLDLNIPVFMYGKAAASPERSNLAWIRRGGLPGLAERMLTHPADFGPREVHPSAGATAIGSREILIAFNIDLDSRNLEAARKIAASIRESSGGLPQVKALGLFLESRDRVQVSMNLVDYRITSVARAFNEVEALARAAGINIIQSEIIGHLPREALDESEASRMKIRDFDPEKIYIEDNLEKLKYDRP